MLFFQAVEGLHFDWTINVGQVGLAITFAVGAFKVYQGLRDNVKWLKTIVSEYRPHIHGGKDPMLKRDDLVFPQELKKGRG